MGGGDCAEVTLVTLEVILRGVVIGQDVAIELQQVDRFNYRVFFFTGPPLKK